MDTPYAIVLLVVALLSLSRNVVESSRLTDGTLVGEESPRYTDSHRSLHRLVRSTTHSHLRDFEISVPELVDVMGNHVSHSMFHTRTRRSVSGTQPNPIFKLSAHGHNFHVELVQNEVLLAPTFVVTRVRRDVDTGELRETEERSDGLDCHYHGRMLSHGNRSTAVSMCDGLTGLLRTEEDDFIVEPVSPELAHDFPAPQHPHIVYKRKHLGAGKQKLHYCGKQKKHPMAISTGQDSAIRYLSDGAIVLKSPDELKNEYKQDYGVEKLDAKSESGRREKRESGNWYRSDSKPKRKVVETLVVADKQLVKNHEADHVDVTTYILTVMNMVTGLFRDGTLDGQIDIVLVGLTLLEDDKVLNLDHRADKSLSNFCHWQSNANTTTGRKPDHSILLTGIDICIDKNQPCDTLGLAQIGGMCSSSDSCTINEDMGLGLAFTVAHETGHSFSMKHDSQGNSCSKRGGHIMSPTLNTLNGVFTWSSCSRTALQKFLRSEHSRCLEDEPVAPVGADYRFPDELPGQMYAAGDQCKLQFGAGAQLCYFRYQTNLRSICKSLWCQRSDGVCETKHMPAAEGTSCGRSMWCRRGECVPRGSSGPQPVNGGWSKYGPWSDCSRSCGGGVSYRQRQCNNPSPRYGGRYCDGEDKIYERCNIQECPPSAIDFRSQQCAEFNSRPYRRQYFTWIPFTKYWKYDFNRCELLCEAEGYGFFDMLSSKVKDGTACDDESHDVCVAGQCVHVGCDNLLNSNATEDACGVCKGDNSTCQFINGTFNKEIPDSGYYHVTRIPRGARTVRIWENSCCTHTYIAIKSASDPNRYYLNGNWRVDLYGETKFAGVKWQYDRQLLQREMLTSSGPIQEDIIVEALIVRKNPGISFSYAVAGVDNRIPYHLENVPRHTHKWLGEMSPCSKSCAGGEQRTLITCLEDGEHSVNNSFCDPFTKPVHQVKQCNSQPCPARWVTEEWGQCSRTCGGGLQTRRVTCKRVTSSGEEYAPPSECNLANKPSRHQLCQEQDCPARWKAGPWSQCSKLCGRGVRTRTVSCVSGQHKLPKKKCDIKTRPIFRQACLVAYCSKRYQWFITAWMECSTTCGAGVQRRELKCSFKARSGKYRSVNVRKCRHARKPRISLTKSCSKATCTTSTISTTTTRTYLRPTPLAPSATGSRFVTRYHHHSRSSNEARWIVSTWQKCTKTCGGGSQVRMVKCMVRGKPSNACAFSGKPSNVRGCNTNPCTTTIRPTVEVCQDKFKWCYLVPEHNTCSHKYFGSQCCKSCREASATT